MKALVTGVNGFIGRNLLNKLQSLEYNGIGIEKDILNSKNWRRELFEILNDGIEVIFHLGAISDTSLQDSKEMFNCNYIFSKQLFDYAKLLDIKVIYSSSPKEIIDDENKMPGAKWFAGARLNFAENLLKYRDNKKAIIIKTEGSLS